MLGAQSSDRFVELERDEAAATFGAGMGFDQVMVFDKRHKMLLKNITLDESKRNLSNFQCQARVSRWWESRDHIHEYAYNSILIGVTDNDTITPFSCRLAVKGSKKLESRWNARNKESSMDEKNKDRTGSNASQAALDSDNNYNSNKVFLLCFNLFCFTTRYKKLFNKKK
ncbi:unnamed protein product [Caenorhabditis brenneri]